MVREKEVAAGERGGEKRVVGGECSQVGGEPS